jgi:hypothetical protein
MRNPNNNNNNILHTQYYCSILYFIALEYSLIAALFRLLWGVLCCHVLQVLVHAVRHAL